MLLLLFYAAYAIIVFFYLYLGLPLFKSVLVYLALFILGKLVDYSLLHILKGSILDFSIGGILYEVIAGLSLDRLADVAYVLKSKGCFRKAFIVLIHNSL